MGLRITYNQKLIGDVRDAFNKKHNMNFTKEKETELRRKDKTRIKVITPSGYIAHTAMDRIEDTMDYLASMNLKPIKGQRAAFNFYDLLNNMSVIIDCIRKLLTIYKQTAIIKIIENSTDIFNEVGEEGTGTDNDFFKFTRSLAGVHPMDTSGHPKYHGDEKFYCSPFAVWTQPFMWKDQSKDISIHVYDSVDENGTSIKVSAKSYIDYLLKWYNALTYVIVGINTYDSGEVLKLQGSTLKDPHEFESYVDYLAYMRTESLKREDYGNEHIIDDFIKVFQLLLTSEVNAVALDCYKNAIMFSMAFRHQRLQNMDDDTNSNTGIVYPDFNQTTELYIEVNYSSCEQLYQYHYPFEKLNYLNGNYNEDDVSYTRDLLDGLKEWVNEYIYFTNKESNEETRILVDMAKYFASLDQQCVLNRNIPNDIKYRVKVYEDDQFAELIFQYKQIIEENENRARLGSVRFK